MFCDSTASYWPSLKQTYQLRGENDCCAGGSEIYQCLYENVTNVFRSYVNTQKMRMMYYSVSEIGILGKINWKVWLSSSLDMFFIRVCTTNFAKYFLDKFHC